MKKYLYLLTIVLSLQDVSAKKFVPFMCPGTQVIAYKQGTSCSPAPYQFFTIDLSGKQATIPFYTLMDVNREVNGIGINGLDGMLYGIEYDRSAACTFSNFHLMRYDATGQSEDLGALPAPVGVTISAALGGLTANGNFLYSTTDASGNRSIAQIINVAALKQSSVTLSASYEALTIVGTSSSYADWAVSPTNGKLYSYGIYNNGGVSTGTVVEINTVKGTISCVGTPNTSEFLDVTRDNFGGVYFEPNGYLYGVNVNTRKLYRIDVTTGAVVYQSTMSGAGQIRADMGSCTSGLVVLPVKFKSVVLKQQRSTTTLNWEMGDAVEVAKYIVEKKENADFEEAGVILQNGQNLSYTFSQASAAVKTQYRIKAELKAGGYIFSEILSAEHKSDTYKLINNPVVNNKLQIVIPSGISSDHYTIFSVNGMEEQKGIVTGNGGILTIQASSLKTGLHFIYFDDKKEAIRFVTI